MLNNVLLLLILDKMDFTVHSYYELLQGMNFVPYIQEAKNMHMISLLSESSVINVHVNMVQPIRTSICNLN